MIKAALLATAGVACLTRGLVRPTRALVRRGEVRRCAGTNSFGVCDTTMSIRTPLDETVYSATSGKVLVVGEDYVHVMSRQEPVILMYQGLNSSVGAGQSVRPGQSLGRSHGTISFSVTQMGPEGAQMVEPASWLVSRGQRPVLRGGTSLWCSGRRNIAIPSSINQQCGLKTPDPSGFALLPVNIQIS